jgi:hypothetical protein
MNELAPVTGALSQGQQQRGPGRDHDLLCSLFARNGTSAKRVATRTYSLAPRSRSAFVMTVTELRLIAAAATIGESSQPSQG